MIRPRKGDQYRVVRCDGRRLGYLLNWEGERATVRFPPDTTARSIPLRRLEFWHRGCADDDK